MAANSGKKGLFANVGRYLVFAVLFFSLQFVWQNLRGGAVERIIIHDVTVIPAAFLVNLITPGAHGHAVEFNLLAVGGGVEVANGCEGMETLFLLFAAFAVAPLSWSARWRGFLLGIPVIFAVNQGRILALFYSYRRDPSLFAQLHEIVAPVAVILVVSWYFYAWLSHPAARSPSTV